MLRLSNAGRDYRWDTRADQARPTQGLGRCPQPSISSPPAPALCSSLPPSVLFSAASLHVRAPRSGAQARRLHRGRGASPSLRHDPGTGSAF